MVRLITNAPQFFSDIAEEIRLFMGLVEVEPEGEAELTLTINLYNDCVKGLVEPYGLSCTIPVSVDPLDSLDLKRQTKRGVKLAAYTLLRQICPAETPWGSLTGIRPTKLFRELTKKGGEAYASLQFTDTFSVSKQKLELAREICSVQRPIIESVTDRAVNIYIGIPFCRSRCLYCSFGSEVAKNSGTLDDYVSYLKRDIHEGARLIHERGFELRALYFGGGTPTVLSADQLEDVLSCAVSSYNADGLEFTVEAGRPDTITSRKLEIMKQYGVERVSVNPQSMNDATLRLVGRTHTAENIIDTFRLVRQTGFKCINMDVIAGLMGESVSDFEHTLDEIIKLKPDNLTVHTLAIKRSSRLKQMLEQYPLSSADSVEQMISLGMQAARSLDMHPYYMYRQKYMQGNLENVGYATAANDCIYNVDMMEETTSILAHGAGAMTKRVFPAENRVERIPNPKDVPTYCNKLEALFAQKSKLFS